MLWLLARGNASEGLFERLADVETRLQSAESS